jgi:hypothetical protein
MSSRKLFGKIKFDIDGLGRYKLLFVPHAEEMEGELHRFFNRVMKGN